MSRGSTQIRGGRGAREEPAGRRNANAIRRGTDCRQRAMGAKGDVSMEPEARSGRMHAVQARPLAELLECPPATGNVLNGSAQSIDFDAGEIVFRQSEICKGLNLVISGQFLRKTERMATRLTLGSARPGDLVELAAALGDGLHTYTLTALTPGSVLLLPMDALNLAFQDYPPLRMRLLEELAREVSRAYDACCATRTARMRRAGAEASLA